MTNDKQKDRLVELLEEASEECVNIPCNGCKYVNERHCKAQKFVDHILADGWMRPPVKIGQELWDIHYNKPRKWEVVYLGYNGKEWHINIHWWKDRHNFKTLSITYPFIGKEWYLTKEEAEAKLKEGVADA